MIFMGAPKMATDPVLEFLRSEQAVGFGHLALAVNQRGSTGLNHGLLMGR